MFKNARELVKFVSYRSKLRFLFFTFLDSLNSIFDIAGLSILMPVFSIAVGVLDLSTITSSLKYKSIISFFPFLDFFFQSVNLLIIFTVCIFIFRNIFQLLLFRFGSIVNVLISNEIASRLEGFYYNLSPEEIYNAKRERIFLNLEAARTGVVTFLNGVISVISAGISCVSIGIFLIYILSFHVVLIFTALILIIYFYYKFVDFLIRRISVDKNKDDENFSRYVNIIFNNSKEVFVFDTNSSIVKSAIYLRRKVSDFYKSFYEYQRYNLISMEILVIFCLIILQILLNNVSNISALLPKISIALFAILRLLPLLLRLPNIILSNKITDQNVGMLIEDLNLYSTLNITKIEATSKKMLFEKAIVFEKVNFSYKSKPEILAISDLSLEIKKGETIGIVGRSGAGKSTFADLCLGILKPISGKILIDDAELNPVEWRNNIGIVPQDVAILNDTIARNIAFGIEDEKIDFDILNSAINQAELKSFVDGLSNGVNGEIGIGRVSGGQKQRIGIARALYFNREILILDEATSALDVKTESDIANSIYQLKGKKTILIIAHRLSTLRHCDRILYFDNSKLIDSGTFDELRKKHQGFDEMLKMSHVN